MLVEPASVGVGTCTMATIPKEPKGREGMDFGSVRVALDLVHLGYRRFPYQGANSSDLAEPVAIILRRTIFDC